jgi:serine protease Do
MRRPVLLGMLVGATAIALTQPQLSSAEKTGALRRSPPGGARAPSKGSLPKTPAETNTVEQLAASARDSIAVITQFGRNGREEGVGAGFVIDENGLIATSLHVIGEARPIRVQVGGKTFEVTEVVASDRKMDLAILRVDAGKLRPLRLGDSDTLAQGALVVAMGNPLGLERSIVQGVLSGRRDFDGLEMLQLAIPIEPGNSGGPLLDFKGRVQGILTRNLGFAMPVNLLKKLWESPNPVPMNRWLTIGAVNPREWSSRFGANWSQRAGRILVEGSGRSFGGRALLLARAAPPERPFDLTVEVKLDDEAGAAGLVFGSDGDERHYGFYPTSGQLRLTRFDGPDVFSWAILRQGPSRHYRPGDWNHLRVRLETNLVRCYVNGELAWEHAATDLAGVSVGLAKFRETRAEFRKFQVRTNSPSRDEPAGERRPELPAALLEQLNEAAGPREALLEALQPHARIAHRELGERAQRLEAKAAEWRRLAGQLHRRDIQVRLATELDQAENDVDLFYAALLLAAHDTPDLDVEAYQRQFRDLADELKRGLPAGASNDAKLKGLREFLFTENGFHGSRTDYYNRANSYINQVLDDREGLPITLSILFLELGRAAGIAGLAGAPLPGHFMVRYAPEGGEVQLIDVFDDGQILSRTEAQEKVLEASGAGFRDEHLRPASKRDIVVRMLHNLLSFSEREGNTSDALQYADLLVAISGEPTDRLTRVRLHLLRGNVGGAREDLRWLQEAKPAGIDLERVSELYESLREREGQ